MSFEWHLVLAFAPRVTHFLGRLHRLATVGLGLRSAVEHPVLTLRTLIALAPARHRRDLREIVKHNAFDATYYRAQYPDVVAAGVDPLIHYVTRGAAEGRNPCSIFDTRFYLATNPDVSEAAVNPLAHFASFGWREGRDPSSRFSMRAFLDRHPELESSALCPLTSLAEQVARLERERFHVFFDASGSSACTESLTRLLDSFSEATRLGRFVASMICLVSIQQRDCLSRQYPGWWFTSDGARSPLQVVLDRAAEHREPALVLLGPVEVSIEALGTLTEELDSDPLFGSAHPRFAHRGALVPVLADEDCPADVELDAGDLTLLPTRYLLPEYVSRCFLIRWELAANLPLDGDDDVPAADLLYHWLRLARRLGFRTVVSNRAVAMLDSGVESETAEVAPSDIAAADSKMARHVFSRRGLLARERQLAAARHQPYGVLLDGRSLAPGMSGTAKAILGLCDGLHALRSDWRIDLLAVPDGADYHDLWRRYPEWDVHTTVPDRTYAAAIRMSQPWHLSDLSDLCRVAAVSAYVMLDTIAWDIVYAAPPGLDAVWRAAGRYADGLIFISEFSRQRFLARFELNPRVQTTVCHLSLDPADYASHNMQGAKASEPFWFVVGNAFDHKWVGPTIDVLAERFPDQRIVVLGLSHCDGACITSLPSGSVDEAEMQRLYAQADVVIYPSFYEGFGLPVVNALSYGRTVLARASALLEEMLALYVGPGRLVPFATNNELIEQLLSIRSGIRVWDSPSKENAQEAHGWDTSAKMLEDFINGLVKARVPAWATRGDHFESLVAWRDYHSASHAE